MTEYWFARRFPVGDPRNSMSPVNGKGWAVVRRFLYWMFGGFGAAIALALTGLFVLPNVWVAAPIVFLACAMFGVWSFVLAAQQHGDPNHTVDDYQSGRVNQLGQAVEGGPEVTPAARPVSTLSSLGAPAGDYWFARYKPGLPGNASRGLIPLNWKGRAAIATFVLGIVLGGVCMIAFGLHDQFLIGIPLFVVLAIAGGSFFLWASVAKTDPSRSAYDYLAERNK